MSNVAVGIDLGTSTSCVALVQNGSPQLLANSRGEVIHASVTSFLEDGRVMVGNQAKQRLVTHPVETVHSAKRLIGQFFFSEAVRKARQSVPYSICEGPKKEAVIGVGDNLYAVPEISALILKDMKRIAEASLGQPVSEAVITVPAYFNDNQRQATRDAGRIAGLNVLRIINEPTAAALAYGFGKGLQQRVAVYDLGGGTFDVSVLELGDDVFEVLSTAGDTYLGGDDLDDRILGYLSDAFTKQHGIDPRTDVAAHAKLRVLSEWGKKQLSTQQKVEFRAPGLYVESDGTRYDLAVDLDAAGFARLCGDLVQRTFQVCDTAMRSAKLNPRALDGVILVGGPTRLPLIQTAVAHYFGKQPFANLNPEQVVALGASLQAHALTTAGQSTMLLDVTPLTLRIEIASGLTAAIIDKNTPVPIERSRAFTTTSDNQEKVTIRVLQGESNKAAECTPLGEFAFTGFQKALRGEVTIEVTFEIDANGIVNVSARDTASGKTTSRTIHLTSGLSEEEIKQSEARAQQTMLAPLDEAS